MRSFIGIDFNENLKKEIYRLQQKLRKFSIRGRWKHSDNFHLTLKFLNEITDIQKKQIDDIIGKICAETAPFNISIKNMGTFNGRTPDSIRVLWLGLAGELEKLNSLNKNTEEAMTKIGFPAEKKGFNPHITLGQDIIPAGDFAAMQKQFGEIDLGTVKVDKLFLFKSEQIENKRIYTAISEYKFKQ